MAGISWAQIHARLSGAEPGFTLLSINLGSTRVTNTYVTTPIVNTGRLDSLAGNHLYVSSDQGIIFSLNRADSGDVREIVFRDKDDTTGFRWYETGSLEIGRSTNTLTSLNLLNATGATNKGGLYVDGDDLGFYRPGSTDRPLAFTSTGIWCNTLLYPSANNALDIGTTSARYRAAYAVTGDFSGTLTASAGVFTTSLTVSRAGETTATLTLTNSTGSAVVRANTSTTEFFAPGNVNALLRLDGTTGAIRTNGHIWPLSDNTRDIGTTTARIRKGFFVTSEFGTAPTLQTGAILSVANASTSSARLHIENGEGGFDIVANDNALAFVNRSASSDVYAITLWGDDSEARFSYTPVPSGTVYLGKSGSSWARAHIDALWVGASQVVGISASALSLSVHNNPSTTDTYAQGTTSLRWSAIWSVLGNFSGTLTTVSILPVADSAHSIGSNAVRYLGGFFDKLTSDEYITKTPPMLANSGTPSVANGTEFYTYWAASPYSGLTITNPADGVAGKTITIIANENITGGTTTSFYNSTSLKLSTDAYVMAVKFSTLTLFHDGTRWIETARSDRGSVSVP